jgi:gamma-glutamyl hercynylcysteine S-oxide synthase
MVNSPVSVSLRGNPLPAMNGAELISLMREFRSRTRGLVADLDERQLIGPRLSTVNPPLWEIGHVGWFQEFWVLRHLRRQKPLLENGDQLYNSTDIAHDVRWDLLLPSRADTWQYLDEVLDRVIGPIEGKRSLSEDELYFYCLTAFHEAMHAEALACTRQSFGYSRPSFLPTRPVHENRSQDFFQGDAEIPGGSFLIGATPEVPFVFDNEKWAHQVVIRPFRIARAPVSNREFRRFVDDGGYREPKWWSEEGWRWLETGGAPQLENSFAKFFNKTIKESIEFAADKEKLEHPMYWRRDPDGDWQQRVFDRYVPLQDNQPVVHVSWYEAEAFCAWAGRRLPTEVEWETAASGEPAANGCSLSNKRRHFPWGDTPPTADEANLDWQNGIVEIGAHEAGDSAFGCRQMIGNVWEWTVDNFAPYPGFTPDPYKEYSKPWFGTHKILRGGCWATSSRLIRNTWRNFYTPDRRDVWAGFRTCAK